MFGSSDPRWGDDPRDRYDADPRDQDDHRSAIDGTDPREQGDRYEREIERDHGWDVRDRDPDDPRDVLLNELDLPRGLEREVVWDHDQTYALNGEDSRNLATVGAFRIVPEGDLRDEGLVETMPLDERDRGVVLTDRGRELLEMHLRDPVLRRNQLRVHRALECRAVLAVVNALRMLSLRFDRAFRAAFGR